MKSLFIITSIFITINIFGQVAPDKYYIEFANKNNNNYSLEHPEDFFSERALQRRANQGILLDFSDLPVTQIYIDSLEALGLEVLNISKWFNSATVYTTDIDLIDTITSYGFISNYAKYQPIFEQETEVSTKYRKLRDPQTGFSPKNEYDYYSYGESETQVKMHNGHLMHNAGYRGQGMLIAVTDAGFTGLPDLPAFDSLYANNRIIATRNFVHKSEPVNDYSTHGMRVLSILAGNYPDYLIGTAPEASYLLLMSEDPDSETFIEELNWISAAEYADSMGADIISISLGYVDFDTPEFDHTYENLDGRHAIISVAANIAARKGMIVVAAAANSGEDEDHPWIAAPGDADSIITAGAVWADGSYASFSSIGPSDDGRIKPDAVAMGGGTYNQNLDGTVGTGNGTSFSTPLLSGLIACLWQQYPEKSNMEIIQAVRESSHLYGNPTVYLGYGIPNFENASILLSTGENISNETVFSVFPNPFDDEFYVKFNNNAGDSIEISISDITGRRTYFWMEKQTNIANIKLKVDGISSLNSGVYIITVTLNNKRFSTKLIKR